MVTSSVGIAFYNTLSKEKIEGTVKRRRKRKQLLDYRYFKETRRCWKLKEEALYRTLWRTRFTGGYGTVVRHIE